MKRGARDYRNNEILRFTNEYDIRFKGEMIVAVSNVAEFQLNKETPFNTEKIVFIKKTDSTEGFFITTKPDYRKLYRNSSRFFLYRFHPTLISDSRGGGIFNYLLYRLPIRFKMQTLYEINGFANKNGHKIAFNCIKLWKEPQGIIIQYFRSRPGTDKKNDPGCFYQEVFMNNFEYNLFKRLSNDAGTTTT